MSVKESVDRPSINEDIIFILNQVELIMFNLSEIKEIIKNNTFSYDELVFSLNIKIDKLAKAHERISDKYIR